MSMLDGLAGVTVSLDGSGLTKRAKLNFVGDGVYVADNPGDAQTDVTILTGGTAIYVTDLAALVGTVERSRVFCDGHTTRYDGGGGEFVWDDASTETTDGGTVQGAGATGRWKRVYSGAINVKWFGLSRAGIQAAIDLADDDGVGAIELPDVNITLDAPLVVPSGITLSGQGAATVLLLPANANYRGIDIDGVSNVVLRDFVVRKASGAEAGGANTYAIQVRGECDNIALEGVQVDGGLRRNISVNGSEGTTPGTCTRVVMRRCRSEECNLTFGFDINHCDGLILDSCLARENFLAGIKIRGNTLNVTITNCISTHNGSPGDVGDGLDAYAGGDTFLVSNCVFDYNTGTGMQIKTGGLNDDTPETWGSMVGRYQLIGNRCNHNLYGMSLTLNDYLDLTARVSANISIIGGDYSYNDVFGITFSGRNGLLSGVQCRNNGNDGLVIGSRGFDVMITDPVIIANGQETPGTYSGISISGTKVTVRGGIIVGVDDDSVGQHSDYGALTVYHEHAISVGAVSDILIDRPVMRYHTSPAPCAFDAAAQIIMHWVGSGTPMSAYAAGTVGSTYQDKAAASPGDAHWIKTAGLANENNVGWRRVLTGPATTGANLDFGSIAAGASADLTLTVTGAVSTDVAVASPQSALEAGLIWNAFVSAADTVTVRMTNITGAPIDPANRFWCVRTFTQGG